MAAGVVKLWLRSHISLTSSNAASRQCSEEDISRQEGCPWVFLPHAALSIPAKAFAMQRRPEGKGSPRGRAISQQSWKEENASKSTTTVSLNNPYYNVPQKERRCKSQTWHPCSHRGFLRFPHCLLSPLKLALKEVFCYSQQTRLWCVRAQFANVQWAQNSC